VQGRNGGLAKVDRADVFDVLVVGAGVVGCALTRAFALAGARVCLIERAADILDGASKANSAILHTGFDAPTGSLELACIRAGYEEYLHIHARLGLPLMRTGALVIAWDPEQEAALPGLIGQAQANGVSAIEPLDARALRRAEPGLGPGARAGFRVRDEAIVDPWSAPLAYLRQAMAHGAVMMRQAEVTGGAFDGRIWTLLTRRGPVAGRLVINAAGLFGDLIDQLLLGAADFQIRPRKGQFVVFDKPAAAHLRHILLPVPTAITKGIVVCPTAFGNVLVGPTAEDQTDRHHAELDSDTLRALVARGCQILPALAGQGINATYAGLRPATGQKEYHIRRHHGHALVTVGGIRSTGLSAALGIARHVLGLCADLAQGWRPHPAPRWPVVPNISEGAPRDWQQPGHGGILCHCEMVTRREVEAALSGPDAAGSLAGLKRRTRVTMGRCQGFYCSAELARLTAGRLPQPMIAGAAAAPPRDWPAGNGRDGEARDGEAAGGDIAPPAEGRAEGALRSGGPAAGPAVQAAGEARSGGLGSGGHGSGQHGSAGGRMGDDASGDDHAGGQPAGKSAGQVAGQVAGQLAGQTAGQVAGQTAGQGPVGPPHGAAPASGALPGGRPR
jgi:glycerol-3-phosphate dehydrogenase